MNVLLVVMRIEFLFLIGLVILTSGCISETTPKEYEGSSTFDSEQEFIAYMESDGSSASAEDAGYDMAEDSGTEELEADVGDAEEYRADSVVAAEWVQTVEDRILISHRYPRQFQSVEIPELVLDHNISDMGGPKVTSEDKIIVEEQERIVAYDSEMGEEWERELESHVQELKLSDNKLILLTRESDVECPVRPMYDVAVDCSSIVRPAYTGENDFTYSLTTLDAESGEEVDSMSFVASTRTEVEVTPEETFISYSDRRPEHEILADFLLNEASIGSETADRVEELQGYNISSRSMEIELERAISEYEQDSMEVLGEEFNSYDWENMRSYEESILMTVNNSDLSMSEEVFDGRISDIESGESTLVTVEYDGVEWDNSETEIKTLEHGVSKEIEGSAQLFDGKILVEGDEELRTLDFEMNEVESKETRALNIETTKDKILASVMEDRERTEEPGSEGTLKLLNSELEEIDSADIETRMMYNFNLVQGTNASYALLQGPETNYLLEIGEDIEVHETDVSGQLVYQEDLYTVGDKVQRLSNEGEMEKELELEIPRMVRPMPEPVYE